MWSKTGHGRVDRGWTGDESAGAIWHALADELARNRSLESEAELVVPWQFVMQGDVHALMAEYRRARTMVDRLRATLGELGLGDEFPGLAASVDGAGSAVVTLGTVSVSAAAHLESVLRSAPPPHRRAA